MTHNPGCTAPGHADTSVANIARVYDCFLGGKDNYLVDREVYRRILEIAPEAEDVARESRRWLARVVRWLAGPAGIHQFLDLGCGLPTRDNTHQIAQRVSPDARVVYVDNDPIVAAHGRALLAENHQTRFVTGDLTQPAALLRHLGETKALDFTQPLGLLQVNTLHHLDDDGEPHQIMRTYIDALPAGSYVALSHFHDPADGSELSMLAREIEYRFRHSSMGTSRFRSHQAIAEFFNGLHLLPASPDGPALGRLRDWWPDGPPPPPQNMDHLVLCGVARKGLSGEPSAEHPSATSATHSAW